jgi:hypothetical protein
MRRRAPWWIILVLLELLAVALLVYGMIEISH